MEAWWLQQSGGKTSECHCMPENHDRKLRGKKRIMRTLFGKEETETNCIPTRLGYADPVEET